MIGSIEIIKKSGRIESFDPVKLKQSLGRIGADPVQAEKIADSIEAKFKGKRVQSGLIFDQALNQLKKIHPTLATKYNLRRAIYLFGPAGYNFEHYLDRVLKNYGYQTERNIFIQGKCLSYETDVLAKKDDEEFLIEAKFHQEEGIKSDLQTVLYIYGRFVDIREKLIESDQNKIYRPWLITNTKITNEGIEFGRCRQIKITAWRYPEGESLQNLIEQKKLYPITILTSLNPSLVKILIEKDLVLVSDLKNYDLKSLNILTRIEQRKLNQILDEANLLLG